MYYPITPVTGLADSQQKSPSVVERLGRIGWKNVYFLGGCVILLPQSSSSLDVLVGLMQISIFLFTL